MGTERGKRKKSIPDPVSARSLRRTLSSRNMAVDFFEQHHGCSPADLHLTLDMHFANVLSQRDYATLRWAANDMYGRTGAAKGAWFRFTFMRKSFQCRWHLNRLEVDFVGLVNPLLRKRA